MTLTLLGRWQTRLLLLATVGAAVTAFFGALYRDFAIPFALLGYILAFGLGWDILYTGLQSLRWNRDWPPVMLLAAGVWEAIFLWFLVEAAAGNSLPTPVTGLPGIGAGLTFLKFTFHYGAVWAAAFLTAQGPMRVIFPRWRYRGGQWL